MPESKFYPSLDLQETLHPNRVVSLWRLMRGFRLLYIAAIVGVGMAAVSKTLTYLLLRYLVDQVLGRQQFDFSFYLIGLAFIGLAAFEGSFTFLSGRWAARAAEGITLRLRNYLFDHLQRLPVSYHDRSQTGELIQRCTSDVDALRRFFSEQALGVGRIFLLIGINLLALFSLNVKLALLIMAFMPLAIALSLFFFKKIEVAYQSHQEQEGVLSTTLQENLSGVRVVKAFARQQFEMDKFEKESWEQYRRGRRLVLMHSFYWPMNEFLCLFQMLLITCVGSLMVIDGTLTLGTYMAFIGLSIWIIFPMQGIGRLIVQMSTGIVSYQRVADIIKAEQETLESNQSLPDTPLVVEREQKELRGFKNMSGQNGDELYRNRTISKPIRLSSDLYPTKLRYETELRNARTNQQNLTNIRGELRFEQVSFEYEGAEAVLHDISFSVKPGEMVALLGPTGSGKSSLVNLLPRFYDYTSGQIWLDGQPLNSYPLRQLRQQIGIVEQEPFLFSRTIRENIGYGVDHAVSDIEIEGVAKAAAIHEVILSFPNGYATLIGEKGVTLSGGQKQRLAIARTLLKSPKILIFDDAVSAVDTETERLIQLALEKLRRGRTTFIIAHRIQTIRQADKILVLDKGRIVQQGNHVELIEQEGIYRQIYHLQAQIEEESRE